jgi:hypothetical protein
MAMAMGLLAPELAGACEALGTLRNRVLHDTPKGSINAHDIAAFSKTFPQECLDAVRSIASKASDASSFNKLSKEQKHLRLLLLLLFSHASATTLRLREAKQGSEATASMTISPVGAADTGN